MNNVADNVIPIHRDPHRETMRLLPWYVTGALPESDRAAVEAHLADCPDCREELAFDRRLATEIAAMPTETEPAWAAMERLLDPTQAPSPTGRTSAIRAALPWVGWALAAQILLVVGVRALIPSPAPARAAYHALAAAAAPPAADVAVIFRPATTEAQMSAVLTASRARLVGGPTSAGAWLLSVPMTERDQAVRGLRRSGLVLTAEPIDPVAP